MTATPSSSGPTSDATDSDATDSDDTVTDASASDAPPPHRYASTAAWREVDEYFEQALAIEDDALVQARESGATTTMPNAEVAPNQGAFLGLLASMTGALRVLEIGTLAGYSTIWFARAVGLAGRVVTLELEPANAAVARENLERAGVADRVDVLEGPAADSLEQLVADQVEPFDLVFIDADKPSNPLYLAEAMRLTRRGSVVVVDNVVRDGAVADPDSTDPRVRGVRDLVAAISRHPELEATALQTVGVKGWDGLIVARRRG
ncbi:O-methyltransferase [Georgenia sp. Z1344]|uniref:O-methyltransferase n=1 Tax=Georgenia sp. Z1344 TaxID=3416706 RepID=UPI003CEB21EB